jgi:hypothetical protein
MIEKELRDYWDYIEEAIHNDKLVSIVITSAAQGKVPSAGFDYGTGKTTLMLTIMKDIYKDIYKYDKETAWKKALESLVYTPKEFIEKINNAIEKKERIPVIGWDDIQATAGREKGYNKAITELVELFTTLRPVLAVFLATAPHMNMIAVQFRRIFNFNLVVAKPGHFEVQFIKHRLMFKDPYDTLTTYEYRGEGIFAPLPQHIKEQYLMWRMQHTDVRVKEIKLKLEPEVEEEEDEEEEAEEEKKGKSKREKLDPETIEAIQELRKRGLSYTEIAKILKISPQTAYARSHYIYKTRASSD